MTSQLTENQPFPPGFRLDKKVSGSDQYESWVATSEQTGDRAFVKVLLSPPTDIEWQALTESIDAVRGLVHENINLIRDHGETDGQHYLIEPYIAGSESFSVSGDKPWPKLKQVIDALDYIHKLGISHGNIHPHNLVVDQNGNVHLTGIGVAARWSSNLFHAFQSPQVEAGNIADATDDIYSLGCLVFSVVTGRVWQTDLPQNAPLPADIEPLITRMMSESPFDRNISFPEVRSILAKHFDDVDSGIQALDFSRPGPGVEPEPITPVVTRQTRAVSSQTALTGLAALVVISVLLFFFLPGENPGTDPGRVEPAQVTGQPQQTEPAPRTTPAEPEQIAPFEAARLEFMQQEGEKVAREILRVQLELEDQGVLLWAGKTYRTIGDQLEAAEESFRRGEFSAALEAYETILQDFSALKDRIPTELTQQISLGDTALLAGDSDAALTAFTIANAIQPGDQALEAKLSRAENLEEVLGLMRRGEMLEQENSLDEAKAVYQEANNLDNLWQPAATALSRTRLAIKQRDFQEKMSLAFQAISGKRYDDARTHFASAQSILPESTEPVDGLQQVEQAETNDAINELRIAAETHMENGAWPEAIKKYEEALAISASLEFATTGLEKANGRLALDTTINNYLTDPTLLQSDAELKVASAALRQAMTIDSFSRDMQRRLDSLAKLISTARIEIPVTILSNGKTSVTVRRHATLGMLESQVVRLIPGRYTITGERSGYRDVREDLVLIAGQPVPQVTVASNERVR